MLVLATQILSPEWIGALLGIGFALGLFIEVWIGRGTEAATDGNVDMQHPDLHEYQRKPTSRRHENLERDRWAGK